MLRQYLAQALCYFSIGRVPNGNRGSSRRRKKPIMWEYHYWYYEGHGAHVINKSPTLAIRDDQWKLLMNGDGSRVELYDLASDHSEVDNKASERPVIAQQLSRQLMAWKEEMPPISANPHPDAGKANYPWPARSSPRREAAR